MIKFFDFCFFKEKKSVCVGGTKIHCLKQGKKTQLNILKKTLPALAWFILHLLP